MPSPTDNSFATDVKFSLDNQLPECSFLNDVDLNNMVAVFAAFQANTLYQNAKILAKPHEQRLTIQYDEDNAVLRMWLDGKMLYKAQLFKDRISVL